MYIIRNKEIRKSKVFKELGVIPDFLVFVIKGNKNHCYVVEIKDGHAFDTKKSDAEKRVLDKCKDKIYSEFKYTVSSHICCFNQNSRKAIVRGFKNKITFDQALTGREFCDILEIDYDYIVDHRKQDQNDNVEYFLSELIKIDRVRKILKNLLEQ